MSDPTTEEDSLISQDDIDQLMNSNATNPGDSEDEGAFEDDDMELISQDDIDRLMNPGTTLDEEKPVDPEPVELEPVVEDNSQEEDDDVIDESEAVDVQDCLIAQETIDDLIHQFDNEATSGPVILDKEPEAEDQPESESDPAEPNGQEDMVLDDTEDFLKSDSDAAVFDFDDSESEDITQDDIDALLLESDDDEENEDEILISQDDIDTLLMTAGQEDEDVLGDLTDESIDDYMDDEVEDEKILENDNLDGDDDEYDAEDQVVLEEHDEEPSAKQEKKKARSQWYKSKLVIACASALIVLGITVPAAYFVFFSGDSSKEVQSDPIASFTVEREIEIETVDIHIKEQGDSKNSGNMILKDFVILASDLSKGMAYITADISIDYSDQKAYHEIVNNLSFYRDLIYDSINKSFASEKGNQITEADILWVVETTLKKVLPGHYINRVSFKFFKAS